MTKTRPTVTNTYHHRNVFFCSAEARRIVRCSKAYKVHEGELDKKSTTGVLQRCISEEEGRQLLAEIHAGLGGHHAAAQALVSKAFHTWFYWLTARADAQDLVQRCVGC